MRKLFLSLLLTSSLFAVEVTFTVVDNSWSNTSVMYKGTATDWAPMMMYDDGTNGDATADDHTWTVVVDVTAGDHQWGAFDVANGDGTNCSACDGTDGYGTWLINGDNPAYSVDDAGNVTGTTSYTIDAYTASAAGSIVFTVDDCSTIEDKYKIDLFLEPWQQRMDGIDCYAKYYITNTETMKKGYLHIGNVHYGLV